MRDGRLQSIKAIVLRQQNAPPVYEPDEFARHFMALFIFFAVGCRVLCLALGEMHRVYRAT